MSFMTCGSPAIRDRFESDRPDHLDGTHGNDPMRPFASKGAKVAQIDERSPKRGVGSRGSLTSWHEARL